MPGEESRLLTGYAAAPMRSRSRAPLGGTPARRCGRSGDPRAGRDAHRRRASRPTTASCSRSTWRAGSVCNARVQTVVEAADGSVVGLRSHHTGAVGLDGPAAPLPRPIVHVPRMRQHEVHAGAPHPDGGRAAESTDLDNLALVCTFHHRLVHEHGWNLERTPAGAMRWLRPDGVRYRAGPRAAPRSLAA